MNEKQAKRSERKTQKIKKLPPKWVIAAAAAILLLCALVGLVKYAQYWKKRCEKAENNPSITVPVKPEIQLATIQEQFQGKGELVTMDYLYTTAARYTDARHILNFTVPLTQKSFVMQWDGVIKAGIDLDRVYVKRDPAERTFTIVLPQARIIAHDPDRESAQVLDEKDGLFNPVRIEHQLQFDVAAEEAMEERAIAHGLLSKAQENAETLLAEMLNRAVPELEGNYQVRFVSAQK